MTESYIIPPRTEKPCLHDILDPRGHQEQSHQLQFHQKENNVVNPKDFLLTKVVEYFNSWSESERTIEFNQLLFIEMSFVESPIVGDSLRESIQGTQSGAPKRGPYDDFPPESLYDITCLYTGKRGKVEECTIEDFLVLSITSNVVGNFWEETYEGIGTEFEAAVLSPKAEATESSSMSIKLSPLGAGSVFTETSTVVPGIARGAYAVDFQLMRDSSDQVASGTYSAVSGGSGNTASGTFSAVSGGSDNTASDVFSAVSGGSNNTASNAFSVVSGGSNNTASGTNSAVSGGSNNTASGYVSIVASGSNNTAYGSNSAVSCGSNNTASGYASIVASGVGNITSEWGSVVSGGSNNEASGYASIVACGVDNTASGYASIVASGVDNIASGYASIVACGVDNIASGYGCVVSGGNDNIASEYGSVVSGGSNNTVSEAYSAIGGGDQNTVSESFSAIGGGSNNTASGTYSAIGGGNHNTASGTFSAIGGGYHNTASGTFSAIGGGDSNTASGTAGTITGGMNNTLDASHSFIGNGMSNTITGDSFSSAILGGANNVIHNATLSAIVGGQSNIIQSPTDTAIVSSNITGGSNNNISGAGSRVGGYGVHDRGISGSDIYGIAGTQYSTFFHSGKTTEINQDIIINQTFGDNAGSFTMEPNSVVKLTGTIMGIRGGDVGKSAAWEFSTIMSMGDDPSSIQFIVDPTVTVEYTTAAATDWSVSLTLDNQLGAVNIIANGGNTAGGDDEMTHIKWRVISHSREFTA